MEFRDTEITSPDAAMLIGELNRVLTGIVGNDGTRHVAMGDFSLPGSLFLVGYEDGVPMCCAGIRQFDAETGEIKRVYARRNTRGIAARLMAQLELRARAMGYRRLILECREINAHAIDFYRRQGYAVCPRYTPYEDQPDAVCMEKQLGPGCTIQDSVIK